MSFVISSSSNPHVKHIKSLYKKKYRDKHNEFVIEGLRIIEHALENSAHIRAIYYCDEINYVNNGKTFIKNLQTSGISLYKIDNRIFKEISTTDNTQGLLAVVKKNSFKFEDIINKDEVFLLVLDRLQDPGNIGTIIRTADAAGVDGIILLKGCVDIYNSKAVRATMGSIFSVPSFYFENADEIIDILRKKDIQIIATTLDSSKYHYEIEYRKKNAIVIGNEGNGISEEIIRKSNIRVKIPIIGRAESLNASIASALIMYEIVRNKYIQKI